MSFNNLHKKIPVQANNQEWSRERYYFKYTVIQGLTQVHFNLIVLISFSYSLIILRHRNISPLIKFSSRAQNLSC